MGVVDRKACSTARMLSDAEFCFWRVQEVEANEKYRQQKAAKVTLTAKRVTCLALLIAAAPADDRGEAAWDSPCLKSLVFLYSCIAGEEGSSQEAVKGLSEGGLCRLEFVGRFLEKQPFRFTETPALGSLRK